MEFHSEVGNKSRHQNEIRENSKASCSRPRTKLRDILMSDKPAFLYADVHHEFTRNASLRISKSSGRQQGHGSQGKARDDEMVKHISKVSSHSEKGKSFQENPLTASPIDLRHLDKLYKHNPMPNKNSGISPSTSSSSYFSTDGSSTNSSRGNSSSPGHQRRQHSPSQPRLETSLVKNYIQDEYYSGKGSSAARQITYYLVPQSRHSKQYLQSEDVNSVRRNAGSTPSHMTRQQKICVLDQNCSINRSRIGSDTFERKLSESNTTSEMGKQQKGGDLDLASSWKGKMRIQEIELKEEIMQSHEPNLDHPYPACSKEHQASVLLSRDPSQYSRSSHLSDSSASGYKIPREKELKSLFQKNNVTEFHCSDSSRVSYSCPLPSTDDGFGNRQSEMRDSCSIMATTLGVNSSPQQFKCPSRSRNTVDMKLATGLKSSSTAKLSRGVDERSGPEFTSKVRQPSPIRRLSSAVGSFIRSAGSRENSPLRRSNSKGPVAISIDESCTEKSQANSRAKSSPLRRLLDPLLKSKASNAREIAQSLKKSSDEQLHLPKEQPVKAKSTFDSSRAKQGSPLLQALLQVSVKNGLPLFTFAVDNDSDILAATLRKLSAPDKNCPSWIYTFFTVHEIKRKNGLWLNHGTKGNGNSYVPNVLAQMKVSNPQFPVDTKQKDTDGVNLREFTLFSVDTAQVDQHATEFQPTNELAAIVAKILKPENYISVDPSHMSSRECQSLLSTTLILPGGVHTIPSKGPVSTLTQRWRFGGSCDCGGWDVGCQLRIFKQDECEKSSNSLKSVTSPDEFKLFSQVGLETQPVLRLKPYKDRIYSVEFDSSISLLQAFATSVAVLDCRRSFSDSSVVEGRASTSVNILEDHFRMKVANQSQGEAIIAGQVSYPPPHSPVGRV